MSEQPPKPLPVDDRVIVKVSSDYYINTKQFASKVHDQGCQQGIKAEILEPGKQWETGRISCRVVVEFIPDEPEITELSTINQSVSHLRDIRKTMNGM